MKSELDASTNVPSNPFDFLGGPEPLSPSQLPKDHSADKKGKKQRHKSAETARAKGKQMLEEAMDPLLVKSPEDEALTETPGTKRKQRQSGGSSTVQPPIKNVKSEMTERASKKKKPTVPDHMDANDPFGPGLTSPTPAGGDNLPLTEAEQIEEVSESQEETNRYQAKLAAMERARARSAQDLPGTSATAEDPLGTLGPANSTTVAPQITSAATLPSGPTPLPGRLPFGFPGDEYLFRAHPSKPMVGSNPFAVQVPHGPRFDGQALADVWRGSDRMSLNFHNYQSAMWRQTIVQLDMEKKASIKDLQDKVDALTSTNAAQADDILQLNSVVNDLSRRDNARELDEAQNMKERALRELAEAREEMDEVMRQSAEKDQALGQLAEEKDEVMRQGEEELARRESISTAELEEVRDELRRSRVCIYEHELREYNLLVKTKEPIDPGWFRVLDTKNPNKASLLLPTDTDCSQAPEKPLRKSMTPASKKA